MSRVIVFGAGRNLGKYVASGYTCEILAVADNDIKKQGQFTDDIQVCNAHLRIISPQDINHFKYDFVLVTPSRVTSIVKQLVSLGVATEKISFYDGDDCAPFSRTVTRNGEIIAKTGKISVLWQHDMEEGITYEIFSNHVYNYGGLTGKQIVIDIGMNVGIASLYFSQNPHVENIYGFEPFKGTYERAVENISLNSDEIKKKIYTFDFGLGNSDKIVDAVWQEDNMGGMRAMHVDGRTGIPEKVIVKDAGTFLQGIFDALAQDTQIILKVDCEGSEYDILESMDRSKLLARCSIVIMETHDGRQSEAQAMLTKSGFIWFWQKHTKTLGFLYAVNSLRTENL